MMAPALVGMANQVIPGFLDRFGDGMSVELRSALNEARGAYGELIELAAKNPNQTLCHTDTHLGNIVFQGRKPRFLDWQAFMIQSFSYDLAYFLNGNPKSCIIARLSSSVRALVTIDIFIPRILSTSSISISGKISCSLIPMV